MDEYELAVEYATKGSDETNEKTINIDLQEYRDSYQVDVAHLQQQYPKSEVNKHIRYTKEQFIFDCISKNLNDKQELVSLINPLVDEIDKYIIEINEELNDRDEENDDNY